MRLALPEALHPPVMFGGRLSPIPQDARHRARSETVSSTAGAESLDAEVADPSFWTSYDYFMLEREARAARRAFIFSTATGWLRKLRRTIAARPA